KALVSAIHHAKRLVNERDTELLDWLEKHPSSRNLGDFFQLAMDPQGLAFIAFDDDSNDFTGNTYLTHQIGGISLTTGNLMSISGKDPAPAFNPGAPQVIDERHDARVNADAPSVPNVDTPVDILSIQYGCEISSG